MGMGMLTLFLAFSFYSVVAGWTLAYGWKSAAGVYQGFDPAQIAHGRLPGGRARSRL